MSSPFQHSTFRRLFVGKVTTAVGDSLYFIGAMWLVYSLTGSAAYTGIAGFLTLVPSAFQFLAGPLVDRWPIRQTLVATQLIQGSLVALIPIANHFGFLSVELVLLVMPLLTVFNQLEHPATMTALPRLLRKDELTSANSAFSLASQGFDMIANGLGGLIITFVGAILLFALNSLTFLIAALLFATVYVPVAGDEPQTESRDDSTDTSDPTNRSRSESTSEEELGSKQVESYLSRLRSGWAYIRGTFLTRLMAGLMVVNFGFGMVLAVLPVYANTLSVPPTLDVISDAGTYGILMAAFAGGNFVGAIAANFISGFRVGRVMIIGCFTSSVCWAAAILVGWLPVTAILFIAALIPISILNIQLAAVFQAAPSEEYVGRVSSLLGSASNVTLPIGSLAGGFVSEIFSPAVALSTLSVVVLLFGVFASVSSNLRNLPTPGEISIQDSVGSKE